MWKKSFNLYLLLGLFLISSSCTMEIQKLRDANDDLDDIKDQENTSYFYLSDVNTSAEGGVESLVFNQLEDQTDYPSGMIQCSSKVTPAPVIFSTYLELTDDNGTLSGKVVFTKSGPKMSMTPCYLPISFSGETLSIVFAGEPTTFTYENDELNGIFTIFTIPEDEEEPSSTKDILEFSILGQESVSIDQAKHIIYITMPFGSSLEGLIASFSTNSLAEDPVTVGGEVQISGVTANSFQEWVAVQYLVTAEDGTTQVYKVYIIVASPSDDRDFLTFSIIGQISSEITIDGEGVPTIYVLMPGGSSLNGLVAEFTTNSLADPAVHVAGVWQLSGATENDFTEGSPKTYWVVSQSELTKLYNVIVITEEVPIVTYKVTYTNDATGGWEEDHEEGSLIDIAAPMPQPDYNFIGWEDLASAIVYQPGDTMTVTEDITFYALWEEPEPTIRYVYYNINAPTCSFCMNPDQYTEGDLAYVSAPFIADPSFYERPYTYTFSHWVDSYGSIYYPDDTFTITEDVHLVAVWDVVEDPSPEFAIGDTGPGGGLIFYVDEADEFPEWTYLEAAPEDLEGTYPYSNVMSEIGAGAQGTAIGTGYTNSLAIISQEGHTDSAAKACLDYVVGAFDDYFLPSKDEVNAVYVNLYLEGVGGFSGSYWYLSSSEDYEGLAWARNFEFGLQDSFDKSLGNLVRCVRAF